MTKVKLITIQIPSEAPLALSPGLYELLNREFPLGGGPVRTQTQPGVWLCFNFQINYQGTPRERDGESHLQSPSWKLENGGFA